MAVRDSSLSKCVPWEFWQRQFHWHPRYVGFAPKTLNPYGDDRDQCLSDTRGSTRQVRYMRSKEFAGV